MMSEKIGAQHLRRKAMLYVRQSSPQPASLGVAFRIAILSPPGEHLVGIDVVTPRHHRHRNPGLTALRDDLALLGLAPGMPRVQDRAGAGPMGGLALGCTTPRGRTWRWTSGRRPRGLPGRDACGYDEQAAPRLAYIPTGAAAATGRSVQRNPRGLNINRNLP